MTAMLLIFDLDGTLFKAKPVCLSADYKLLEEWGVPAPDEATLLKNAGCGVGPLLQSILPDGADIGAARARYIELVREEIIGSGELFPGALEAVRQLKDEGHELAVCSNSPGEYIKTVLEHTGIAGVFARYYSAEGHATKAGIVRGIVAQSGWNAGKAPAPAVIGDTHGDIEAAHANGLIAIAAMYGYGNKAMLAAADYFAGTPEEIVSCVHSYLRN